MTDTTLVEFIIIGLAVMRISFMFVREHGPFDIFLKIRDMFNVGKKHTFIADLLSCTWCLSMWVGILATITYMYYPRIVVAVSLPFALSSLAIAVEASIDR